MSYKGDKIANSIQQHMSSGGLDNIADTLLRRKLGEKHFESAKTYMQTTLEAAKEKIQWHLRDNADGNPNITLGKRQLELYLMYMAVNRDDHSEYVPAIERMLISQNTAIFHDRFLPLRLYAPHLEFRHVQRSTKALEYHEDPFKFGMAFSLFLSKALEDQIPVDSREEVSVVIPQPKGMFLGSARRVHPLSYAHATCLYVIYDEQKGTGKRIATIPEWLPTVEITAKTYIHSRDFFGGQRMLHQMLIPFYEEEEKTKALGRFVDAYVIGGMSILSPHEKADINAALTELRGITQDRIWDQEVRKPSASLAKKDLQ